ARLDGVLLDQRVLPADSGDRSVDSPPGEEWLLGSMAQSPNADRQSSEDGRLQRPRDLDGAQFPWAVALRTHRGYATRHVQQVAGATALCLAARTLGLL